MNRKFIKNSLPLTIAADQRGSVLIISLLILAVLAVLGVVASSMSVTELKVAANDRIYNQTFYAADGAWQKVPVVLDSLKEDDPAVSTAADGSLDLSNWKSDANSDIANGINGITYTRTVTELPKSLVGGYGGDDGYVPFQYQVVVTAKDPNTGNDRQKITVVVQRPFKVGY